MLLIQRSEEKLCGVLYTTAVRNLQCIEFELGKLDDDGGGGGEGGEGVG